GRSPNSRRRESGRSSDERTDRRHGTESRFRAENRDYGYSRFGINEADQFRDHNERLREADIQRRSHGTESRFHQHNREKEYSGSRLNETGQTRDHKESGAQQQRLRNVEMQRRSHETESRFQQQKRARASDFDERTQMRHEQAQSSRPGAKDCLNYRNTGWCNYGKRCHFNHPPHFPPVCKFFLKGTCEYGSNCRFKHTEDEDFAEPVLFNAQARIPDRRASESTWRFDEGRHETESRSMPEIKRARTIPDSQEHASREKDKDLVDGIKRAKMEKMPIKEAENNLQQQELREEMPENRNIDAQQNLEEQRRIDIEKQREEERLRLEQIQTTVQFDELGRPRELMKDLGFRDCDGF
ncbi:hypothetical protein EUTSA_v10009455mg, partial [Eutrema salsugineum]